MYPPLHDQAAEAVDRMQIVLTDKKVVVDAKTADVQALIAVIQEKTKIANEQQEQAAIKQKFAEEQAIIITKQKAEADEALMEALPAVRSPPLSYTPQLLHLLHHTPHLYIFSIHHLISCTLSFTRSIGRSCLTSIGKFGQKRFDRIEGLHQSTTRRKESLHAIGRWRRFDLTEF